MILGVLAIVLGAMMLMLALFMRSFRDVRSADSELVESVVSQSHELTELVKSLVNTNVEMTEQGYQLVRMKLQTQVDIARLTGLNERPDVPTADTVRAASEDGGVNTWSDTSGPGR